MSVEIPPQKTEVVFKRDNKTVKVFMYCDSVGHAFIRHIWRNGDSLLFDTREIKGNLYDLLNVAVERYFRDMSNYTRGLKLLNLEKPEGDLLKIVENVFCSGKESSLLVEYEFRSLDENLFDCKDCG